MFQGNHKVSEKFKGVSGSSQFQEASGAHKGDSGGSKRVPKVTGVIERVSVTI